MKNFRMYLICTSILLTFITFNSYAQELKITRDGNLRSGPSTNQEIIGKVTSEMNVTQLEKAGDWYKVKLPNQIQGWIHKILITKVVHVYDDKASGIHEAAKRNDIEKIRDIISKGGNINAKDRQKRTALHYAAVEGHNDLAKVLVDAEADIDVQDKWGGGNTPIEYTVFDIDSWNKTISYNEKKGMGNKTMWNKELFDFLIEHNAKVRPVRLLLKAVPSNDTKLLEYIESKWNVSLPKDDGRYVYEAVVRGAHKSLEWLIDRGAELNEPRTNKFTPLHIAAMNRNARATKMLLNAGAAKSLTMKDNNGKTPLEAADKYFRPTFADLIRNLKYVQPVGAESKPSVTGEILGVVTIDYDRKTGEGGALSTLGTVALNNLGIIKGDKGKSGWITINTSGTYTDKTTKTKQNVMLKGVSFWVNKGGANWWDFDVQEAYLEKEAKKLTIETKIEKIGQGINRPLIILEGKYKLVPVVRSLNNITFAEE